MEIKWEVPGCNNCKNTKNFPFLKDVVYWENPNLFFRIVKCKNCSLAFLSPRPKREYISKFYKIESYWGQDLKIITSQKRSGYKKDRERIYGPVYKLIPKRKGAIFDVGAGTGLFLSRFAESGWKTDGIEFSKSAVEFAKKNYNVKLKVGDFLDYKFEPNSFDVVTLNNVLEHLYDPLGTLKEVRRVLRPDGVLIITVPNIDSLGFKIFKKKWYPLQPPIHLYHFTPVILSSMLNTVGFTIIDVNHFFWVHSYFSLYESFRHLFTKNNLNGRVIDRDAPMNTSRISPVKEMGKIIDIIFSSAVSFLGSVLGRGETIIIRAKPSSFDVG